MQAPNLHRYPYFSLDTETTGLSYPQDKAFGVSIATPDGKSYYWDIRRESFHFRTWLAFTLDTFKGTIIAHSATFDAKMLLSAGIDPSIGKWDDVAIRACLIDEHLGTLFPWTRGRPKGYGLDTLCKEYTKEEKVGDIYETLADLYGGKATRRAQMPNLHKAEPAIVAPYAKRDAEITLKLWEWQEGEIKIQELQDVCSLEKQTIPYVYEQETTGVRVDLAEADRAIVRVTAEVSILQAKLDGIAGKPLNANSSPQLRELFKPEDGKLIDGTPYGTTPKGNPSIDNATLQAMQHPAAKLIIEIRSALRTRDTFLKKHIIGHAHNGRVYPNINQVAGEQGGTKTGRFSYVDPALQQIPNRNKTIAAIVKLCFLPDEGQVWADGDMDSFEVRIFAHLVGQYNSKLVHQYIADPDTDLHQWVADLMGIPRNPRADGGANAKQLNLSMIFNSGRGAIAHKLGLPCTEARFRDKFTDKDIKYWKTGPEGDRLINKYHEVVRGVHTLASEVASTALGRGHVRTLYGRHLRFPRGYKSYKASGLLIQATAADINKANWKVVSDTLGDRGRLILNTHDSYSMSIQEDAVEEAWKDVKHAVESEHKLRVPLKLSLTGTGKNWWEAVGG